MTMRKRAAGTPPGAAQHPAAAEPGAQPIPVTLYRSDDRLTLAAPMPGLEPEDITVDIRADGTLCLMGARRGQLKGWKDQLLEEWSPGPYHRDVRLPDPVNGPLTNVTYRNGVLVVAMPLADRTTPRRLTMEKVGVAYGERDASAGHPIRPT